MRVISEHCSEPDERSLYGLVHFAKSNDFGFLASKFIEEAQNETKRRAVANEISNNFKARFNLTNMVEVALKMLKTSVAERTEAGKTIAFNLAFLEGNKSAPVPKKDMRGNWVSGDRRYSKNKKTSQTTEPPKSKGRHRRRQIIPRL